MLTPSPITRGKLTHPPLPPEFVHRLHLMQRLAAGSGSPITLIAAPAGYGKSTLVAEWLDSAPRRAAWLALDEHHNTLGLFCSSVLAAIQSVFPGALPVTSGMIHSNVPLNPRQLATALSDEIAELPEEFILVLDDYHWIHAQEVHELLGSVLRRLPKPLRLILTTRTNVSLPFGKLRAAGQLFELHARDLLFTLDETRAYFKLAVAPGLDEELVQRLHQRIEGWAVGLRFASLLLREGASAPEAVERLITQNDRHMMDYLLDEVLAQQTPQVREFLLKTSLVERFTARLCDAILDFADGESSYAIVDELVRDDLLHLERDENDKWYKYVDLFREFLRAVAMARYSRETIGEVHRRASCWFHEQGLIADAIRHAITAGDLKRAAQMVGENIHAALDRPPARPQIESWLALFPAAMLDKRVELVLARVWLLSIALQLAAIPPLLAQAEQLLDAETDIEPAARRRMMGEIAYHRMFIAYFTNNASQVLELACENFEILKSGSGFARGSGLYLEALSYQMVGKTETGLQRLAEAQQNEASASPEFTTRLLIGFGMIYLNNADLHSVAKISATLLRLGEGQRFLSTTAAHYGLGLAHYERNQLEVAAQHFAAAAELSYTGNLKVGQESFAWLALTQQQQGASAAANATLQKLLAFTDATRDGALLFAAEGYRARLALLQGNLEEALHWAQGVALNPRPHMLFDAEANLTRLRILLASRKPAHLRTMLEETDALLSTAQSLHNPRRTIQFYALQALGRDALGSRNLALESLEQAITLAEPSGLLRTFLDLGPAMARLLNLLAGQSKCRAYVNRILAAGAPSKAGRAKLGSPHDDPAQLIEPLTMRELEVLQGLAQRQTNKEIAQRLVISVHTVNAHIDHIYQKLGVNDRQRAVQSALAYGIIDLPSAVTVPA